MLVVSAFLERPQRPPSINQINAWRKSAVLFIEGEAFDCIPAKLCIVKNKIDATCGKSFASRDQFDG
jgi:hypothetical protein